MTSPSTQNRETKISSGSKCTQINTARRFDPSFRVMQWIYVKIWVRVTKTTARKKTEINLVTMKKEIRRQRLNWQSWWFLFPPITWKWLNEETVEKKRPWVVEQEEEKGNICNHCAPFNQTEASQPNGLNTSKTAFASLFLLYLDVHSHFLLLPVVSSLQFYSLFSLSLSLSRLFSYFFG